MPIHLYAEHLVNIRTLSLQASLSTVSNRETRATLSSTGNLLTLEHEGESASIRLPITVPGSHSDATLTIPAAPTKDLSFRVSLSEKTGSSLLTSRGCEDMNVVPWTAIQLTGDTQISCKYCQSSIVERGAIHVWKDLPSENWAEMMDFWHCHKPSIPDHENEAIPQKGYSASSRLALATGVAMVDPVDFVFKPANCQNLVTVSSVDSTEPSLQCSSCHTVLGRVDQSSDGFKIRKLHLSLSTTASSTPSSFDIDKWLACHLLSSVESQGVRKFVIQSVDASRALKVWIFTPDTMISSSNAHTPSPSRVVKILWVDSVVSSAVGEALSRESLSEGEIELPSNELVSLREHLVKSANLLPESGRRFQSWNVALLRRFSSMDAVQESAKQRDMIQLPEVPDLLNKDIMAELVT